jgi:hypothetical protein
MHDLQGFIKDCATGKKGMVKVQKLHLDLT